MILSDEDKRLLFDTIDDNIMDLLQRVQKDKDILIQLELHKLSIKIWQDVKTNLDFED